MKTLLRDISETLSPFQRQQARSGTCLAWACAFHSPHGFACRRYSFNVLLDEGNVTSNKGSNAKATSNSTKQNSSSVKTAAASGPSASKFAAAAAAAATTGSPAPGRSADGKPVCYTCGAKGHTGDRCKQPYCERCDKFRHVAGECSKACRKCGALDHRIDGGLPCKNYQCKECGLFGHVYAECPNIVCNICTEYGHLARDCPQRGKAHAAGSAAAVAGSGSSSGTAAAPAAAGAAGSGPKQQQDEEQRRSRVMDLLMSRLGEGYALALLGQEQKLIVICAMSDDTLQALLAKVNPQQQLEAAVARLQLQQAQGGSGSGTGSATAAAAAAAASAGGMKQANGSAMAFTDGSSSVMSREKVRRWVQLKAVFWVVLNCMGDNLAG